MEPIRYEFLLEAMQPIAHHSETFGNSSVVMRRKLRRPDGSFSKVPYVTGDTMRHGLREAGTYALLEAAGMLGETLNESALRLLFAGGMVTGSGGAVKLDDYRELTELCPHLALLGGCAQNRVIPGKLRCDDALLVCSETSHLMPEWVMDWSAEREMRFAGARDHVELAQRVRMDPMLDPGKRKLLSAGAREDAEQRLLKSENSSEMGDHKGKDEAKSAMLPRTYETLVPGSLFYWRVSADCHSDLDKDTLLVIVAAFLARCRVGGKQGTGNGQLRAVKAREIEVPKWKEHASEIDATALGARAGAVFRAHVAERSERIREYLGSVNA